MLTIDDDTPLCFKEFEKEASEKEEIFKNILELIARDKINWKDIGLLLIRKDPELFYKLHLRTVGYNKGL